MILRHAIQLAWPLIAKLNSLYQQFGLISGVHIPPWGSPVLFLLRLSYRRAAIDRISPPDIAHP
jgi:hypothetical protein